MHKNTIIAATIATASLLSSAGSANAGERTIADMPLETLKTTYLNCEREALWGDISAAEIRFCSVVYEELKERAFEGSFRLLRNWYEAQNLQPLPEQNMANPAPVVTGSRDVNA